MYSQDLSNRKTEEMQRLLTEAFLYSQDLSNRKTRQLLAFPKVLFLYSQDLSNRKTLLMNMNITESFCTLKI